MCNSNRLCSHQIEALYAHRTEQEPFTSNMLSACHLMDRLQAPRKEQCSTVQSHPESTHTPPMFSEYSSTRSTFQSGWPNGIHCWVSHQRRATRQDNNKRANIPKNASPDNTLARESTDLQSHLWLYFQAHQKVNQRICQQCSCSLYILAHVFKHHLERMLQILDWFFACEAVEKWH